MGAAELGRGAAQRCKGLAAQEDACVCVVGERKGVSHKAVVRVCVCGGGGWEGVLVLA